MLRLDYSNGLFYGLPKCTVSGLQAVQNSNARIIIHERLRDHDSMPRALMELHWLLVKKKIEYKLMRYIIRHCVTWHQGIFVDWPCRMRHGEFCLLTVPPGKPGKYASRSFARASANLLNFIRGERAAWLKNSPTLERFQRNIKTYLFWERFSS